MYLKNPKFKNLIIVVTILMSLFLAFGLDSKDNIYPAIEINDSSIGYYQSTTCNISLLNVLKENFNNKLNLSFNNNNYPEFQCFGRVTGLDKVNDQYIVSIGTNSLITFILQSTIWILLLILLSKDLKFSQVNLKLVSLLSIFFTFQQLSEARYYSRINSYFDNSINIKNYYLLTIFLIFYLSLMMLSMYLEKNKEEVLNYFPFIFLIIGTFNGFNLSFFSMIFAYLGLRAMFKNEINKKFSIIYFLFFIFWLLSTRENNTFFDGDKLNSFINTSNSTSSLVYWGILIYLIIIGIYYLVNNSSIEYKKIAQSFILSSNLVVIFGLLGAKFPLVNFLNLIFFGQNKKGINSLSSIDGNTWRGFSASAESIGEFYGFLILFIFLGVIKDKLNFDKKLILFLILPTYGLYKTNNFAVILSLIFLIAMLLLNFYIKKTKLKKTILILLPILFLILSFLITLDLGLEYVSTNLLYEASLHSNLFNYLSSEAKSIEITSYFNAGQIDSLLTVENNYTASSTLLFLSDIYHSNLFNIRFIPNIVTLISLIALVINRSEMWGIFIAKYDPNIIEALFGNGPMQMNNYLYKLKIALDVPESKINSLYLPHSSFLDIIVFFGLIGFLIFLVWNFYIFSLKTNNFEYKFILIFILLNFAKSDSLLYLNSILLLFFSYTLIIRDKEEVNGRKI